LLNATSFSVGQTLQLSIDVLNMQDSSYNATNPNANNRTDWEFGGWPILAWSRCWSPEPLEFIVVQGNYTLGSLANADPSIAPELMCTGGGGVHSVVFQANSDVANVVGEVCSIGGCSRVLPPSTIPINATLNLTGYYNSTELVNPGVVYAYTYTKTNVPSGQIPFVPAVYTVAVSDEWGASVILHFTVT